MCTHGRFGVVSMDQHYLFILLTGAINAFEKEKSYTLKVSPQAFLSILPFVIFSHTLNVSLCVRLFLKDRASEMVNHKDRIYKK